MRLSLTPISFALVLMLAATGAAAQTATPAAASPAASPAAGGAAEPTLSTVVVTATKIAEPLLGTPSAITVLTAPDVESQRVRSVEDLSRVVPNLKLDNGYGPGSRGFLSIRGIGNSPGSMDPSASIYVDDIPYHDFNTYSQSLFDVQQVEVLRGAQGTLYGGFAQAGVIDIRSVLPGREVRRQGSVELFSPQNIRSSVSLSGPVSDSLSLGVGVIDERGESFIRNVTLGKRSERQQNALRLQGVLSPDASTELVLTVLSHRQRNDGGSDYMPVQRSVYNTFAGVNTDKFEIANNIEGYQNVDTDAQSLRFRKRVAGMEYTVIAANRDTRSRYQVDFNYGPTNAGFLFASTSDDRIDNQHLEARARWVPASPDQLDVTLGASWMAQSDKVFNTVNLGATTYDIIDSKGRNASLFMNGRLPLNSDGLELLGGLRYETAQRQGQNGPSDFRTAGFGNIVPRTTVDSRQLTWKLGVSDVTRLGDVYAHVSTGWRPGGVNYYTEDLTALTFRKERSLTYEAGWRHASDGLYLSAAAFFTRVRDYQETQVAVTGAPGRGYLANVATVHVPGFEVEARKELGGGFTVHGSLGYTRARYQTYAQFPALQGKPLGNRPDWNLSAGVEYRSGAMTYAVAVSGTDDFYSAYTSAGNTTRVDGHVVANFSATYRDRGRLLTFYIDNLTNEEYFLNAGYYNYGAFPNNTQPRGQVGAPRTIGVKLKVDF